ncbi:leucine-rich repeat protein [Crocinitomix sp.]|nr:leucine-rich repeat protein [Crocinitomix sp.]
MKKCLYLFISIFCMATAASAQGEISLGLCEDLPNTFYLHNYNSVYIENGQGYCKSPVKILDKRIANFKNLEQLTFVSRATFDSDTIVTLPEEISQITSLRRIHTNIPNAAVFNLSHLTHLGLQLYDSTSLALFTKYGCKELKELTQLTLHFANFGSDYEIPGIAELAHLKTVYLANPNQKLVDAVLSNPNVENLHIDQTKGITFDFSRLKQLKSLTLYNNQLSSIPPSIYKCENLEELIITNNMVSEIGDEISQLKQLKLLNLANNHIYIISDELSNCTTLTTLALGYNRSLSYLPTELGNLKLLNVLSFGKCKIEELPKSIEKCVLLKSLYANNNQLKQIDLSFKNMQQLESVSFQHNQITQIDSSLFKLPLITKLDVSQNQLTTLPYSIGSMKSLVHFDIFENKIKLLPYDIGELTQLEELTAYRNEIMFLPPSIVNLRQLIRLYLGDNNLTELPENFQKLNLQAFEIQKNPLKKFPIAIYELSRLDRIWISPEHCKLEGYKPSDKNPVIIITD